MSEHCAVRVNTTHLFVAGGTASDSTIHAAAFLHDWAADTWTRLPDMAEPRAEHACGLASDPERIVVVGGVSEENVQLERTLIFDLAAMAWRQGPEIPARGFLTYSQSLPYGDSFVLVGGYGYESRQALGAIWRFKPETEQFVTLRERLARPRAGHAVVALPVDMEC